jgi:hypothetical protein
MKLLTTIALAAVFALSSTFAFAYTTNYHHRYGAKTYHGSYARMHRGNNYNYGRNGYGNPNNRGGLVGGSDAGTYRP